MTLEFALIYGYQSAKTNMNVEDVFFTVARDIKQRLAETDSKPEVCLTSSWKFIWGVLPVCSRLLAACVSCFTCVSLKGFSFNALF